MLVQYLVTIVKVNVLFFLLLKTLKRFYWKKVQTEKRSVHIGKMPLCKLSSCKPQMYIVQLVYIVSYCRSKKSCPFFYSDYTMTIVFLDLWHVTIFKDKQWYGIQSKKYSS